MNKVIIIGNDHTNTLGLTQTLGRNGYEVTACVWGKKRGYVAASRYCHRLISASTPQGCIDKLLSIDFDGITPIIASCDDAAYILEKNRKALEDKFVFEHTTSDYTIEDLLEKKLQVSLAKEAGLNVPKTWTIEDFDDLPLDLTYPCIIKPLVSCKGAKADLRVCKTLEDVNKNLATLKQTSKVLIQQYIERDYEISILGCGKKNGEVIIPCVENKLTLYPKYVGLECLAEMQPLTDTDIISAITNLVRKCGYVGVFSVEMMHCKDDDKFYFTEINLRNDGANSFVYKYGVNLPLIHICDLTDKHSDVPSTINPGFYIWDMHHFLSLIHKDISFATWYKEIKKSRGFLTYFPEDKRPFFRQYSNFILEKLRIRKLGKY